MGLEIIVLIVAFLWLCKAVSGRSSDGMPKPKPRDFQPLPEHLRGK